MDEILFVVEWSKCNSTRVVETRIECKSQQSCVQQPHDEVSWTPLGRQHLLLFATWRSVFNQVQLCVWTCRIAIGGGFTVGLVGQSKAWLEFYATNLHR